METVRTVTFAGLVASKNSQVGDVVNPMMGGFGASGSVLTLVDDSRIKVVVEVSPSDISRLGKGRPASIRVSNGETIEARGTITVVNTTADAMSKKFRVEVAAANPGLRLRPGTFGTVLFEVGLRENVLAVPLRAVLEDRHVFVAVGGKAVKREVKLGLRDGQHLLVEGRGQDGVLVAVVAANRAHLHVVGDHHPVEAGQVRVAVLEELARDVTGWPAKAVEFFELLAATQHLQHLRPGKGGPLQICGGKAQNGLELLGGPFENAAYTVDVRRVANSRGKYNLPNIGLYLWRLKAYTVLRGDARAAGDAQAPAGR